jgi:hypothetical protein
MDADPDAIRDRLQVMHLDDTLSLGSETMWYAEDPRTGCIGLGAVEAEAVGNAISVTIQYERDAPGGPPHVKVPGKVVEKSWAHDRSSLFERVRDLL